MSNAFREVLAVRNSDFPLPNQVTMLGADPVLSTRFRIGETCAAVLAGIGVAVSDIWAQRTGRRQNVSINVRHAAAALRSTGYALRPGADGAWGSIVSRDHLAMRQITQPWPTKDGRWFLPHFGLPNLKARVLNVLKCKPNPVSVAKAVEGWDALDLESAIDEAKACGAMVRSREEWTAHPHGQTLAAKPIVEIIKIGDSDPEPFSNGPRPLSGINVLDLTRILAGPIAARTLAEHGAEVLMVTGAEVPQIAEHVIDTSHGKRSCYLNLKDEDEVTSLRALVADADVFSQGYRPGVMEKLGFGPEDLARIRPGIVCASISCFGEDGPLSHRAGWEQVAQTVTGICHDSGQGKPMLLPAAACDYTTGDLAAYGILRALARRAMEGGSYHIRASLCQSGMFIDRQGQVTFPGENLDLNPDELDSLRQQSDTAVGPLRHLGPVLALSETPPDWTRPTPVLGSDLPLWLERHDHNTIG